MSYVEMHNVLFRGTLRGSTGVARFKLDANAVNAINTVNVRSGSVTFERIGNFSRTVGSGGAIISMVLSIPDSGNVVETLLISSQPNPHVELRWAGSPMPLYHMGAFKGAASKYSPIAAYRRNVTAGSYTVQAVNTSGSSHYYDGFLMVRYMRETGQ